MRARLTVFGAVLLVAGCGGSRSSHSTAPPPPPPPPSPAPAVTVTADAVKATLLAPTRSPKINARWRYSVKVTDGAGHPVSGRLTIEIVDPIGSAHAVQFDDTKQDIVRRPFKGQFRDYLEFPGDSRGFRLTFRVIVQTTKAHVTLLYPVTPR